MKIQIISLMCCYFLSGGCSQWLGVQPYDQISEGELVKSEEGFQKLLNGIYIELNDDKLYGSTLTVEMIEVMGGAYEIKDDVNAWGNYPSLKNYDYATEYWRGRLSETWNKAYSLILNCNKLLENMEGREALFTGSNYNIIRGEALALRAMLHFDMLRLFGPVYSRNKDMVCIPYYTSQTLSPEPLLPASEVMAKVTNDLKEARILLSADPVITEGTLMSGGISGGSDFLRYRALRLNYFAVTGLLSRVCLYAGQSNEAYTYATEVIKASNNGIFPFVEKNAVSGTLGDPDRIFSTEVLFALSHHSRNSLFLNYFDPSRTTFNFHMEPQLIDRIIFGGNEGGSPDDYRYRANWVASGNTKYFYKYADISEVGKVENTMIPLLRLGEMYLIAAESQSAVLASGISFINTLRKNRGIAALSALTEESLKYEYIRELYGEGQLFFMYKRMYSTIIRSYAPDNNPEPGDQIFVVPLPDSEMDNR